MTFMPNPNPSLYNQINHKNGNKLDNRLENLEWSNNSLNQLHANRPGLNANRIKVCKERLSKPVVMYDNNGIILKEFISAQEAYRQTGIDPRAISYWCTRNATHGKDGYYFNFKK